jgi:PilZ domain-containing protein
MTGEDRPRYTMMPHDRRLSIRKTPRHLGYLSLPPDNGGFVLDVSEGGLGFQAIAPLKPKGPIQFRFAIDSPTRIRAVGELAWIDDTGKAGGLRFTQLPEGIREKIRDWVNQPKDAVLDLQIAEPPPVKKPETADARPALLLAAAPQAAMEGEAAAPAKAELEPVAEEKSPRPHDLKTPIYGGHSNKFTMFPVEEESNSETTVFAVPQSNAMRHPIAAISLTIILALLVSVPIFVYVNTSPAGDLLFDWSQKFWGATDSQAIPQDPAPPASPDPELAKPPQQ